MKRIVKSFSLPEFICNFIKQESENTGLNASATVTKILNEYYQGGFAAKNFKNSRNLMPAVKQR
tara:strand:- start:1849 stop:2040 length:192 start_codon:yes stop_codon:yes gene_type:complete